MKKLFFTAIALVAFSGISMANTIEIKYLKTGTVCIYNDNSKINETEVDLTKLDQCWKVYMSAFNYYNAYFGYDNPSIATQLASGYFQDCMYGTLC